MMIAGRRLIEVLPEHAYGADPGGTRVFPAFLAGDQWATRQRERVTSAVSRAAYGATRSRATMFRGSFEPVRTYLYDRGAAALDWTLLLEAAGCRRRGIGLWEASPGPHTSLTLRDHRDGAQRLLTGCRGALTLRAEAGEPVEIEATLSGRARLDIPLPLLPLAVDLPDPIRLCNVGLRIAVEGWPVLLADADSIQLDTGTALITRRESHARDERLEFRVGDVLPSFRCTLETSPTLDWESARGLPVSVTWGIGEVDRWDFELPRLELVDDPETTRLGSGLEGQALVFASRDGSGAPLRIRHTPG